jgi:integrase
MNVKVDVKLRKDRADKKGLCPLQVSLYLVGTRKRERKTLSVRVHPDDWDEKQTMVRETAANHKTVNQFIRNKIASFEKNILEHTILEGDTNPLFVKELVQDGMSGKDFYAYTTRKIEERFTQNQIKSETRRQHVTEVAKMKEFHPGILRFSDITPEFLGRYRSHMIRTRSNVNNTQWKTFKFVRTYFNCAKRDLKLKFYPFEDFKFTYKETTPIYLIEEEIRTVREKVDTYPVGTPLYYRGHQFLFSCFVGFRFADLKKFINKPEDFIQNGKINLVTNKQNEPVWLPITGELQKLIDVVKASTMPSLTHYNRGLKEIAAQCGINKDFSSHIGRHTVGVTNAENGVDIKTTQKILGHRKLASTEIYYNITDRMVAGAMQVRDDMFKRINGA